MKMTGIPFGLTDWSKIERTEHPGTTGMAYWRTREFGDLRVRMVEGRSHSASAARENVRSADVLLARLAAGRPLVFERPHPSLSRG